MRAAAPLIGLAALFGLCGFGLPSARADSPAPYEMIRSLQSLQSRVAAGDKSAAALQADMMTHIAANFTAAPSELWKDPKNSRAAVTFVLSGGDAAAMNAIIGEATAPAELHDLMQATLAYGQGREADAKKLFAVIDAHALVESVGGQVALVEAILILRDNRQKAIDLLDFARLTMPGSLVEEAALRREVFVFGEAGDIPRFIALSRQYIRRFRRSIYADNFLQAFVAATTRFGLSNDMSQFAQIEDMLTMLGPDDERNVLLLAADAAVVGGKMATALSAAKRAADIAPDGSVDQARARLYQAAAVIASDQYDQGLAALKGVGQVKLPQDDSALRDAVTDLAAQLRAPAKIPDAPPPNPPASAASATKEAPLAAASATVQNAQKALADSDRLLGARDP